MARILQNSFVVLACALPVAALAACSSSSSGTGASTTTTAATGGSTTTTTSGSTTSTTSAALKDACKNAADGAILASKDVASLAGTCAQMHLGDDPATSSCIKTQTSLSDNCITCFVQEIDCAIAHCLTMCASDPGSAACSACRATNCDPAFTVCSGISASAPPDAGPG